MFVILIFKIDKILRAKRFKTGFKFFLDYDTLNIGYKISYLTKEQIVKLYKILNIEKEVKTNV